MIYEKTIGRITVLVNAEGGKMHDYAHGCSVSCVSGWNDNCPTLSHIMSVEEMRDLHYLLERAITAADQYRR
jgi:hypothetical protein